MRADMVANGENVRNVTGSLWSAEYLIDRGDVLLDIDLERIARPSLVGLVVPAAAETPQPKPIPRPGHNGVMPGTLAFALLAVSGCAGHSGGDGGIGSVPAEAIMVSDGPLANALAFNDVDGDGVLDPGEYSTRTDATGQIPASEAANFTSRLVVISDNDTTDTLTGQKVPGLTLSAPAGATVVTPLTSLVDSLMQSGLTEDQAEAQVRGTFNLPASVDLSKFDPYAGNAADAAADEVAEAGRMAILIIEAASRLTGKDTAVILGGFSEFLRARGSEALDLTEGTGDLTAILTGILTETGDPVDETAIGQIADALRNLNESIAAADSATGDDAKAAAAAANDSLNTGSGSAADDTISGDAGDNFLGGMAGNDVIDGLAGDDVVSGGTGHDILRGGDGDDRLEGGEGNDQLAGGLGVDKLGGGQGNDTLLGNAGNDSLTGGAGDDNLKGDDGDDTLYDDTGDNQLSGGSGTDTLIAANADGGLVLMEGGSGADVFGVRPAGATAVVNLMARIGDFSQSEGDRINLANLRDTDNSVLTFSDILNRVSDVDRNGLADPNGGNARIDLTGLVTDGGRSVTGDITIIGLDSDSLNLGDFVFDQPLALL